MQIIDCFRLRKRQLRMKWSLDCGVMYKDVVLDREAA